MFCEQQAAAKPDDVQAQQALAWVLFRCSRWQECLDLLRNPSQSSRFENGYIGSMVLWQLGRKTEAMRMLSKTNEWMTKNKPLLSEQQKAMTTKPQPNVETLLRLEWEAEQLIQGITMENVTKLLERIEDGDSQALDDLFPIVYDELRRLAASFLAKDFGRNTLQATALVNEAYIRLVGANQSMSFHCRRRFFSAASKAMRSIVVDAARRRLATKRGGGLEKDLIEIDQIVVHRAEELLEVHEALDALAEHDDDCAELVKLHYFSGFSMQEISEILGVSTSTANRLWKYSRAWLKTHIGQIGS